MFASVVEELDLSYIPARFYRNFANILIGDLNTAVVELAIMNKKVEEAAEVCILGLVSRWLQYPPRLRLLKLLRFIRSKLANAGRLGNAIGNMLTDIEPAIKWWSDITTETIGGNLHNMARSWSRFDDERKSLWEAVERRNPKVQSAFRQVYLKSFGNDGYIRRLVEVALNMREGKISAEDVEQELNILLNLKTIELFDHKLHLLEINLSGLATRQDLEILSSGNPTSPNPEPKRLLDDARKGTMGLVFEEKLKSVEDMISKGAYEQAKRVVIDMRDETRQPSREGAAASIMFRSNRQLESTLAKLIIPALRHIDRHRQVIVADRFYLESRYYKAVALYQTFSFVELPRVLDEKSDRWLRSYFEDPLNPEEQSYELVCLFHCLLITAAARLACADVWHVLDPTSISPVVFPTSLTWGPELQEAVDQAKGSARYAGSQLIERLGPALSNWRTHPTNRLKAAAASAIGHWARVERERFKEGEAFISELPEDQDSVLLLEEALAYEPSAIRHIELAELLTAERREEEAERLLRRAQCIAPRHPLPARWLRRR